MPGAPFVAPTGSDSGRTWVVRSHRSRRPRIEAENERLKRQLRDTLLEADASGKMRTVLEELLGIRSC